jgi:hypothetical protein
VKAANSAAKYDLIDSDVLSFRRVETEESSREKEFSRTISESILILRIALVRMDDLITKTKDLYLKQTLVSKRIALHSLVDELMVTKKRGQEVPEIVSRLK